MVDGYPVRLSVEVEIPAGASYLQMNVPLGGTMKMCYIDCNLTEHTVVADFHIDGSPIGGWLGPANTYAAFDILSRYGSGVLSRANSLTMYADNTGTAPETVILQLYGWMNKEGV